MIWLLDTWVHVVYLLAVSSLCWRLVLFLGKILVDDTAISEYNIDEKKFIVVMVTKPKAPEKSDSGDGNTAASTTSWVF